MADTAGLLVGDMILSVNGEDFVGASYETAAKVILCFPAACFDEVKNTQIIFK